MFDNKVLELMRRGETEKANYLKNLNNVILPSFARRIKQNDKSVLKEIVVPKWVEWNLLVDWAQGKAETRGRRCILCNEFNENGLDFNNKFVCGSCFLKIKNSE